MSDARKPCTDREAGTLLRDLDRSLTALEYADHFTPKQAAEFLGRTIHILAKWRKDGSGPPWTTHPDGWHVLYPFKGLVQWHVGQGGRRHRFTRFDKLHADGFMTEDEAAAFLGVGQATLARWRREGKVQAVAVPSKFNLGGSIHLYTSPALLTLRIRIRPRQGYGRGRGSLGRLVSCI